MTEDVILLVVCVVLLGSLWMNVVFVRVSRRVALTKPPAPRYKITMSSQRENVPVQRPKSAERGLRAVLWDFSASDEVENVSCTTISVKRLDKSDCTVIDTIRDDDPEWDEKVMNAKARAQERMSTFEAIDDEPLQKYSGYGY